MAVKTGEKDAYRGFAERMVPVFKKHGALSLVECWGDDVPGGDVTSFPMAVKCAEDETVVFSWIIWPDKAAREAGNKGAMAEMETAGITMEDVPFDGKRMIFGGFEVLVES